MGKGSNVTLHHFFAYHKLGERTVHLHADNCGVWWAEQKLHYGAEPFVEGDDRPTHGDHIIVHDPRPYEV